MNSNCSGEHRFFVAEVAANATTGDVYVLTVCTACGDFRDHKLNIGSGEIRLLLETKNSRKD